MPIEIQGAGAPAPDRRAAMPALLNGARGRCPACSTGRLFGPYLKVVDHCAHCGEALHHQRADDAPPYFTMFIVGHIVIGGVLSLERAYAPESWVHLTIWLPLTVVLSLALLPVVKGALVALQWALRMHGFGIGVDPAAPEPDPAASVTAGGPR
jgi:uncharacterized protein (DUF983 family)